MKKIYTVLIVDDERLARERVKKMLQPYADTFILKGEASNAFDAEKKIHDLKPDLIFLDIEMPELNGFELIQRLEEVPLIVFCTAYEEYSLKAFETNSVDYLVKPVKEERFQQTILKVAQLTKSFSHKKVLQTLEAFYTEKEKRKITSITVKKGDKVVFVKLEEISHFKATEKYVSLFTSKGSELIEESLTRLEQKLPAHFLRIHRSVLVNTEWIEEIQKYFNNRFIITLNNGEKTKITSGRTYKEAIKQYINQ